MSDAIDFVVRLSPGEDGWTASVRWPTGGAHFTAPDDYELTVEAVHKLLMEVAPSTIDLAEDRARRERNYG